MRSLDGRIKELIEEGDSLIREADAAGRPQKGAAFSAWKNRAEGAVIEKLGELHPLAKKFAEIPYRYVGVWTDGMRIDELPYFKKGMEEGIGILRAAFESEPIQRNAQSEHSRTIINIDNSPTATANASATAQVTLDGSAEQLRRLIAEAEGLSREERAAAIGAVPDDDELIDLASVDKLLGIATKTQQLLTGIAGWVVANADRLPQF